MKRYLLPLGALLLLALVTIAQRPTGAAESNGTNNTYLPVAAAPPAATATPQPTATPAFPNIPWSVPLGQVRYQSNSTMHWVMGSTLLSNGDPAVGDRVQVCFADASGCTGPSAGSRLEHNGIRGYYDWVGFAGGNASDGNGNYFAVLVNCTGYTGQNPLVGGWPLCREHSARVYFTIQAPNQSIAIIDWQRVAK